MVVLLSILGKYMVCVITRFAVNDELHYLQGLCPWRGCMITFDLVIGAVALFGYPAVHLNCTKILPTVMRCLSTFHGFLFGRVDGWSGVVVFESL